MVTRTSPSFIISLNDDLKCVIDRGCGQLSHHLSPIFVSHFNGDLYFRMTLQSWFAILAKSQGVVFSGDM